MDFKVDILVEAFFFLLITYSIETRIITDTILTFLSLVELTQ